MIIRQEGLEQKQPDDPVLEDRGFISADPHPSNAYMDGQKLAVWPCPCSYCVQENRVRASMQFDRFKL